MNTEISTRNGGRRASRRAQDTGQNAPAKRTGPTPASTEDARLRKARRRYRHAGYRVWKVRTDSRWYREFGPFSVIDEWTNVIVDKGLELDVLVGSAARRWTVGEG